jgi:GTP-binding protein
LCVTKGAFLFGPFYLLYSQANPYGTPKQIMEIRNIAIIAHVDHGKTTLTDALMRQTGMIDDSSTQTMDSNQIEQERGITIYAKNTSVNYKGTKINILDTPGHADFGSEVERVLKAVDSVLLLVDAQEGPMPQTRFVLKKSLELGHEPIIILNKIDKPASDPKRVLDEILELFIELGAEDHQLNFPVLYAIGRDGVAMIELTDERKDLMPLLDTVLEHVPIASVDADKPFQAQTFNLGYDNFLGRLSVARVYQGVVKDSDTLLVQVPDGAERKFKITKLFTFNGVQKQEAKEVFAGDICMIAGITDGFIGDTLRTEVDTPLRPGIAIDEPTISLSFLVNDSPFAGREGKFVTSRQIRERLEKELEVNVGLKVDFNNNEFFTVYGRGELHIAVLLEQMRREGYELQVSEPQVIIKEENGKKLEPYEEATIDVPSEFAGAVIEKLTRRRGLVTSMTERHGVTRILVEIPTRGLLGYRSQFIIETKGEGILSSRYLKFDAYAGEIKRREVGSMTSMVPGKALSFSLGNLQDRGVLYIEHGDDIYEGMVVGNVTKGEEMVVNPTKGKQLTNMRASGTDETIYLKPAYTMTIERGLEIMASDEYLEITPKSVRLRKKILSESIRMKGSKK